MEEPISETKKVVRKYKKHKKPRVFVSILDPYNELVKELYLQTLDLEEVQKKLPIQVSTSTIKNQLIKLNVDVLRKSKKST